MYRFTTRCWAVNEKNKIAILESVTNETEEYQWCFLQRDNCNVFFWKENKNISWTFQPSFHLGRSSVSQTALDVRRIMLYFHSFTNSTFSCNHNIDFWTRQNIILHPASLHSIWTRITPPSGWSQGRWYLFDHQRATPTQSFHIVLYSNRYHFGGIIKTFCIFTCSRPPSPSFVPPASAPRFLL